MSGVHNLQRCVLGLTACPERPLIVSVYWFMHSFRDGAYAGEDIWMGEVVSTSLK